MPLAFGAGAGSGFASPGSAADLSAGFSVALGLVVSVGSPSALVGGLMELSAEGSAAWGAFGWSVAAGVGSGDELAMTLRGRDLLAGDEELDGCCGSFFPELS